jgi:hypothetical protein
MKYLIVSGDSFTDDNFSTPHHPDLDCSWPKWPEILAEKLGMKLINLAICGKGQEFIYSSLQDQILSMPDKSEIGLVIAAWSQCQRRDYQMGGYYINPDDNIDSYTNSNWHDQRVDSKGDLVYWASKSLRYFSAFEMMCERYNIPYAHTQMIDLYKDYIGGKFGNKPPSGIDIAGQHLNMYKGDREKDEAAILKLILSYDKIIDTSKFLGWPLAKELGGNPLNRDVFGEDYEDEEPWIISYLDNHPNAAGQVKIAEYLYDRLDINVL